MKNESGDRVRLAAASVLLMATLLLAARSAASPHPSERRVEFTYRFTAHDISPGAAHVAVWVPVPPSNGVQQLLSMKVLGPYRVETVTEPQYGNRFLHFELTDLAGRGGDAIVQVQLRVARSAYHVSGTATNGDSHTPRALERFLAADQLIPIDGRIAEEARRAAGDVADPLQRARRLYDHIVDTMVYDKREPGWGRGDALRACDVRRGNCTDFHSLFIAEARSLGIPARFIMGVPLPQGQSEGVVAGYHCWAEFYVAGMGWVPVDASEAQKLPEKRDTLFAGLDANRIQFTVGRDITLPRSEAGPLNYIIYPHIEVDGTVHTNIETQLSFRDLP